MPSGMCEAFRVQMATKQTGTKKRKKKKEKEKKRKEWFFSCRCGKKRDRTPRRAEGEARYLSQPVWSDISSPGKTEAAAAGFAAAAAAAGAASSACATFGRTFETYLMSSTRPAARPAQSPSVKAASAFSPGSLWRRRLGP